ncbi:MAG TPA: helix-hairpin-helix domain-containing protein [Verrucomicrobiae bacterium]|nr:helix-hairpin-helix domain-containing protein [Verrucomicrobiae bacterium]
MRLPFFRSPKAEPTKTIVAPPPTTPRAQLAETQLIVPKDEGIKYPSPPPNRGITVNVPTPSGANGTTIPIPVSCIFQQLPTQLLAADAREKIDHTCIRIPADWILPQLSAGKVTFALSKLLPLLPQNMLRNPPPVVNSQHPITLPLDEVVKALPADLLTYQNQTTLDIDTPEFDRLPKLFDDTEVESPVVKPEAAEIVKPTEPASAGESEPDKESVPLAPPPPSFLLTPSPVLAKSPEPAPKTAPATSPTTEDKILVTLRSLVAVMPDHVFICPRAELWRRIDLNERVPLPRDVVLPQLQSARLRIPLSVAVEAMPSSILASPLPSIGNESVPLALQEIVPQLPPGLFTTTATLSDDETLDFSESEIPIPFQEKIFAAEPTPTEVTTPIEATTAEPSETETEAESREIEVETEAFADEGLSIFAEKGAASEPVAPANVEASSEPVLEAKEPVVPPTESKADVPAVPEPKPDEPVSEVAPAAPVPVEVAAATSIEQPTASTESTPEPATAPAPFAEVPTVSEAVSESVTPPELAVIAASAVPTENKFLINLNQCAAEDLAKIEGVGPVLAQRIIEFRNARGGFKSPKELRLVPGINRKTLRTLTGPAPRTLNRLLGVEHNEELTLQEIVRLTSQLKGVAGCILAMSDGVFLTGQLPSHLDQETISVFAPQLFKKVGRYMKELRVGQVTRLSVFTDQQPLSIFHAGDIFLVVIHDPSHFSKALLRRCERISEEIARLCRQRAVV